MHTFTVLYTYIIIMSFNTQFTRKKATKGRSIIVG